MTVLLSGQWETFAYLSKTMNIFQNLPLTSGIIGQNTYWQFTNKVLYEFQSMLSIQLTYFSRKVAIAPTIYQNYHKTCGILLFHAFTSFFSGNSMLSGQKHSNWHPLLTSLDERPVWQGHNFKISNYNLIKIFNDLLTIV